MVELFIEVKRLWGIGFRIYGMFGIFIRRFGVVIYVYKFGIEDGGWCWRFMFGVVNVWFGISV